MTRFLSAALVVLTLSGCASTGGPRQTGGALIGAVGGGVIGSQFGGGKGRIATTIAGTVIGGLIGSEIGQKYDREAYYENRGTTYYSDEPVRTYRVYR